MKNNINCTSASLSIGDMKVALKEFNVEFKRDKEVLLMHSDNLTELRSELKCEFKIDRTDLLYSLPVETTEMVLQTTKRIRGIKLKNEEEGKFIEYEESDWSWLVFFGFAEYIYEDIKTSYLLNVDKMNSLFGFDCDMDRHLWYNENSHTSQ